jgi:hypothetical protein
MTKPLRNPAEPLRTQHVFRDAEVYRRTGNRPFDRTPFTAKGLSAKHCERPVPRVIPPVTSHNLRANLT